jgi:hypothetical protein
MPDPIDHMPTRAEMAHELLLYRVRQLSTDLFDNTWDDDIEFELWQAVTAESEPYRFRQVDFAARMAAYFRHLSTLAGGWWAARDALEDLGVPLPPDDSSGIVFLPLTDWAVAFEAWQKAHHAER